MKIKPVMTEKSMADAKLGTYTFWVPVDLTKFKIKEVIGRAFGVKVQAVRTQTKDPRVKTTLARKKIKVKGKKKAYVQLSGKDTIDIFDTETKKKKKTAKKGVAKK